MARASRGRVWPSSPALPKFTGDLDGLDGADGICQARATANARPGAYTAWLSIGNGVDESPASGRFRQSGQPHQRVDGVSIADDWAGLTSGTLQHPLNVTETGAALSGITIVWTNTLSDGTAGGSISNADCQDWTDGSTPGPAGNIGNGARIAADWTNNGNTPCLVAGRLYCFQQT